MKKIIKHLLLLCALMLLLPAGAGAQALDGRRRTAETVIADNLTRLPAQTPEVFNQAMAEMAATGSRGVELIAAMLGPASESKNATFEYALNGIVVYATAPGNGALLEGVRKGLLTALANCTDDANRAFLLSQLQFCATVEEAPAIAALLDDPYLADDAIRTLISIPGTEPLLRDQARRPDLSQARKRTLAYAFGEQRSAAAEPILLGWLAGADAATTAAIYNALGRCGAEASLKPLAAAAARVKYADEPLGATAAYLNLLSREAASPEAVKAAKGLLKSDREYVRGAALAILVEGVGAEKAMPYVLDAVKKGPAQYRFAALQSLGAGSDALFAKVAAGMPRYDASAQADVLAWLGDRAAASQSGVIASAVMSADARVARNAIAAAGRVGGPQALTALVKALEGPHSAEAMKALLAFNGDIAASIAELLKSDDAKALIPALKLAAARRMTATGDRVFALLDSKNEQVRAAAYETLPYVVSPADADRLAALLNNADAAYVPQLQSALTRAVAAMSADDQYSAISRYMKASSAPVRYYPVLARTGTQQAVLDLLAASAGADREASFAALLTVGNPVMVDILYTIASENPELADRALARYADLVSAQGYTPVRRYQLYRQALELKPAAAVRSSLLRCLAGVYTVPALMLSADYLGDAEVAPAAAFAVKTIVAKSSPTLGGETVAAALKKAQAIYTDLSKADPDAGYAANEIAEQLSKLPATGFDAVPTGDLSAWSVIAETPSGEKALSARKLALVRRGGQVPGKMAWSAADGVISFDGKTPSALGTSREYENFEMWLEWRSEGAAGLAVRSIPQIGLGVGPQTALAGCKVAPAFGTARADNAKGEWNTLYVKVINDRMNVYENGVPVAENVTLTNAFAPGEPIYTRGRMELLGADAPVEFRSIYVNELPSTPIFALSPEEKAQGYEVLFDGRSLHNWKGNTTDYVPVDGTIYVSAEYGGSGNLYTVKEYGDFDLRFEFRFMSEGVNNGIGIRTREGVDAAYDGMEIQVLDHDAPVYQGLAPYQSHGSVYGIIPAKHVTFGELQKWYTMEIKAVGDHITVTVEGDVILDGNIREACQGHNMSDSGEEFQNQYTVDHRNHPGLFNKKGYISFCGHGPGIQYRNVRVLDLDTKAKRK